MIENGILAAAAFVLIGAAYSDLKQFKIPNLMPVLLKLSVTNDWDKALEVISCGPTWIKALAGMATMNAIAGQLQRMYETELLGESPQTQGEN